MPRTNSVIPVRPENERFTDRQWQAVFDGGDNLLVSASAGSGKTTVLVRRVIEKLKSGADIDRLLIVTFTEAAASEMKERIEKALRQSINQENNNQLRAHYVKQLVLLPQANISTLHAFCMTVIKRFYYLIDLDPVFRLLSDETEKLLLQEEVWSQLREAYYANDDEDFFKLTENFGSDRSDEGLTDLVMRLYQFSCAAPDPTCWLDDLPQNYQAAEGFQETALYQTGIKPTVLAELELAVENYEQAIVICQNEEKFVKDVELLKGQLGQVKQLQEALLADDMTALFAQIEGLDLKTNIRKKRGELADLSLHVKELQKTAKDSVTQVVSYFPYPEEIINELLAKSYELVLKMSEVTKAFSRAYTQKKLAKGVLDFNDLEHYTLAILQVVDSPATAYYKAKFSEVMVDEYQDINRLQEAILSYVRDNTENAGNMFMVGDVKQSIYAFRLADPTLFIEKYNDYGDEKNGRRIVLAENFRSRKEVLDFTNLVFEQLMDEQVGQINYDEAAALTPGFPNFPASDAFHTELLLFEKGTKDAVKHFETRQAGEIQLTALKIKELIFQSFKIYDKDKKKMRPLEYGDIVLLTPTKGNNQVIVDTFYDLGIPLEITDAESYFQTTEIQTIISLLKIIDNPYNDIPLASVLRSPIVGLLEDELAQIRLQNKNGFYYEALIAYGNYGEKEQLKEKIKVFLTQLKSWRAFSKRNALPDLIWRLYEESAYLDYCLGLPNGIQRHANLIALVERAKNYEKSNFRGLYQFISLIEKMQEKDLDLAEPATKSVENAVRVMTIHGSKGLEFPIVFLLDMARDINRLDFNRNYIFEEQLGAGIKYVDQQRQVSYETMPYQGIKQVRLNKAFSEEMRKLYVAVTRAEQKLYLVGSYENKETALQSWQMALTQEKRVLNPALRLKGSHVLLNWVGMTLMRHPDMEAVFSEAKDRSYTVNSPAHFTIHWFNQEEVKNWRENYAGSVLSPLEQTSKESMEPDLTVVKERLDFIYPYEKATQTTSYQSVTEIKRVFEDPDNTQENRLDWQSNLEKQTTINRYTAENLTTPRFISETKTDAASVGTATHTVLQLLDLKEAPTEAKLEQFIAKLVAEKILTTELAGEVSVPDILWFFETPLGQKLIAQHEKLHREEPFAMLQKTTAIFNDYDNKDDELLIHGIIDGYILTDEILLYDFKTDHLWEGNKEQLVKRYQGQINLYRKALMETYDCPVTEAYLVFLKGRKIISLL
ncbi:ATP-dependent helicase/nuclease subunit A [Enterococcus saigonensis]|uniref:ATP-dependent helicase/nuclease subunit A n=1 Tax=Enterococcus saigonensis TaxID=1805431 RepID=A0A679I8F6_9ENTE|nr:helicase-exonuclease AddAB subunit AddA [Enterococcus saigonensis]BCA85868.1 ATP-dependent helicase/nuclease subunit A [Enterococcus saigonensis]